MRCDSDTNALAYPFEDRSLENPLMNKDGGLLLSNPSNIKTNVEYNPNNGNYDIYQKMGDMDYRVPMEMDSDQYMDYMYKQSQDKYFKEKTKAEDLTKKQQKGLIPPIHIGGKLFTAIFGSNTVTIRPQGSAELTFGFNNSKIENPALPVIQRSLTTFNFDENIQLNVTGEIGDKLKLSANYNTKATFEFQNQMKLAYQGHEDDIIKEIDAGNITFPLPGTLIQGSQSLFGLKTKLQFGRLTSTTIYAQDKGQSKTIMVQNGAQVTNFNIKCDQFQVNQNYFLSMFFYNQYDKALAHFPLIGSNAVITRIEVWVTNTNVATQNTRDIIALADLGESCPFFTNGKGGPVTMRSPFVCGPIYPPSDSINSDDPYALEHGHPLISSPTQALTGLQTAGLTQVTDYEKVDLARMLSPSEFTLNAKLGYISLKQPLNYDQVLAVAYQYTYEGRIYQVGQFSTDGVPSTNELIVKMLKSTNVSPDLPLWKLMMKNIYALGSYQINSLNFMLQIWYSNLATGVDIPYLPQGALKDRLLLSVMGLDQLDVNGDPYPDGIFDFLPGITIDAADGLVILPSVEPFGSYLANKLTAVGDANLVSLYTFPALYDSVLVAAQQEPNLDRYWLRGSFQSSASSDISLNATNIPPGSVIVTAGGIRLTENVDYTVDYTLGRVKILNQGLLSSGTPISISLENNALFSVESKTYFGQHFDYMVSKDFNLGATVVNYTEHPLTQIVSIGQEPVSNTMIGLNGDFKTPAPFLTRWIDALPGIHTKAPSEISASSEVAGMIPGHPKFIGSTGNAYIDDFEGSESFIDISTPLSWSLASVPQGQASAFPEANDSGLNSGFNRAKVNWYVVDPLFQQQTSGVTPGNESSATMSNNFNRMVLQTEIFPQEQSPTGTPLNLPVLNVAFYPTLKGPYNYEAGSTRTSAGINNDLTLKNPDSRWGGIMRPLQETDFETDNIQFIEFWLMDPYNQDDTIGAGLPGANSTGSLFFDIGDVSEDVLKDGQKSFENGLPQDAADYVNPNNINNPYTLTDWARIPVNPSLVNAFSNNDAARPYQDIGLDGMDDTTERRYFANSYLKNVSQYGGPNALSIANADPSGDDYHYYRGDDYDALNLPVVGLSGKNRYMMYNGLEGNSPTEAQYAGLNAAQYPTDESTLPNTEDINQDNTLNTDEAYFEYEVKMNPIEVSLGNVGNNFITDAFSTTAQTPDGRTRPIKWYQFKIPVDQYLRRVGPIADFKSIRFIRMYFKGFNKPVILRFAKLELVRDEWRKYTGTLLGPGDYIPNDQNISTFNMYGVNLEENSATTPVNYVIPPGIQRQLNLQSANLVQLNEGSLAVQVCDLISGDARGVYRNVQLDLRAYKTLQMFSHCQSSDPSHPLKNGDVTAFIRLGSDYTQNYYEYEIPLQVTPPGSYNTNNNNDELTVWPADNNFDIPLSTLENAKLARDAALATNKNVSLQIPYTVKDGNNNVTVIGNPTISSVQIIMLGVRNPKRTSANAETNNGLPKCAEVWFDELRMTDFSEKGGVATINRVTAKLADLGTLSLAGNVSTPGFGTLEANVGSLSRETDEGYNIASNLEMGKFTPQKWNLSIPTYVGYGQQIVIPEYNPLDPDILTSSALSNLNKHGQDTLKSIIISNTIQKSLNFTNVHKNRGKNQKKTHFYDIENFSATYTYSEKDHHDVNTAYSFNKLYTGGLMYSYSFHPKALTPLTKIEFFKKRKYLSLISDFNFYPWIDKVALGTNVNRTYSLFQTRNTVADFELPPAVEKSFDVFRTYNIIYPLTKSIRLEYTATNDSRVMEPEGRPISTSSERDSVWHAFLNHQVNTDFKQTVGANYEVPIKKIPFLNFITLTAHYAGSYEWQHAPFAADSLGATIINSNTKTLNGQLNMVALYDKIPFLKKLIGDNNKNNPKPNLTKPNLNNKKGLNQKNQKQVKQEESKQDTDFMKSPIYYTEKYFAYLLTSLKNVSFTYNHNTGVVFPGYVDSTRFFGMDDRNGWAPGPAFVFGDASGFLNKVQRNNWLVPVVGYYNPYTTVNTTSYNIRATLEPIPDFKIDITATHTQSDNTSQYIHDSLSNGQLWRNPVNGQSALLVNTYQETGNFSMTYFCLPTMFQGSLSSGTSPLFNNYLSYRSIISARLGQINYNSGGPNPLDPGYYGGYSGISQSVVIPAFIAAYSGQSPNHVSLNPFPIIPLPNWTITYSGIPKIIPWVKKNFTTVVISSAYSSTYTVGSYNNNLLYGVDQSGMPVIQDLNGDFLPKFQIPLVSLTDQLSPLIKLAATLKSGIMSNIEVRLQRQFALSMSDLTITEVYGQTYIIGLGYKLKNVLLPFKIAGKAIKNDLTLKADFSLTNNETFVRNTEDLSQQVTGGASIISVKVQAEYNISTRVSFRIFLDKIINNPYISSTYPTSTLNGGIAIRFTLS